MTSVTVRVPAKINLQLAVGPLRPDGYHGLVTVFHAVSLFDEVTVVAAEADSVTVSGEGAGLVPENADNLALRAVRALRQAAQRGGAPFRDRYGDAGVRAACGAGLAGLAVTIAKRIPVAGGMAGGSADAAAALVACNELWGTGLSQGELCEVGRQCRQRRGLRRARRDRDRPGPGEQLTPAQAPQRPTTGCSRSPTVTCPPQRSSAHSTDSARARKSQSRSFPPSSWRRSARAIR